MAEKETVAPKTVATEKMVPFTMGTLDTKSIGLTSATIRPRAYCAKGGPNVSARVVRGWASNARHYAGRRLPIEWVTGPLQSNARAPALKAGLPVVRGSVKKSSGHGAQEACAGKGGAGQLLHTQSRVPASRSDHQTIATSMKACAQTLGP